MSWTYTGDPANSDRDAVRFLIQDTVAATALVQDEEIAYALTREASTTTTAALLLETLARRYAQQADLAVTSGNDTVKRSSSAMAQAFADRARELRTQAAANAGLPWHGGTSLTAKADERSDLDRVQPSFRRGQFDLPGGVC